MIVNTIILYLERRQDRLENLIGLYKTMPNCRIFPAPDATNINFFSSDKGEIVINHGQDYFIHNPLVRPHLKLGYGEAACLIGHYSIWKYLLNMPDDQVAIILEDDAVCQDANKFLASLEQLPDVNTWDWCQLYMDRKAPEKINQLTPSFYKVRPIDLNRLSSIIVTKRGVINLLKHVQTLDQPADNTVALLTKQGKLTVIFPEHQLWTTIEAFRPSPSIIWELEKHTTVEWNREPKVNWIAADFGAYTGIGNQMFQYAALKVLAMTKRTQLLICPRGGDKIISSIGGSGQYALDNFPYIRDWQKTISMDQLETATRIWKEKDLSFDSTINDIDIKHNWRICGYLQNIKYIEPYVPLMRLIFDFDQSVKDVCNTWMKNNIDGLPIAVHLRLPNVSSEHPDNATYSYPTEQFVYNSMEYMFGLYPTAHFIICSNDINRAQKTYKIKYKCSWISLGLMEDLCLMSHCQHFILGPSTYGWWAAVLSDNKNKSVVMCKPFFNEKKYPELNKQHNLILDGWKSYDMVNNTLS